MWSIDNIFDLYQTVYNKSITNETISKRSNTSYDIVVIIFLIFICVIILICMIRIFVRRNRKYKDKNYLQTIKNRKSKINENETNISETSNQSDSIQ
jgi:ATP-dependent Zn protease